MTVAIFQKYNESQAGVLCGHWWVKQSAWRQLPSSPLETAASRALSATRLRAYRLLQYAELFQRLADSRTGLACQLRLCRGHIYELLRLARQFARGCWHPFSFALFWGTATPKSENCARLGATLGPSKWQEWHEGKCSRLSARYMYCELFSSTILVACLFNPKCTSIQFLWMTTLSIHDPSICDVEALSLLTDTHQAVQGVCHFIPESSLVMAAISRVLEVPEKSC